MDSTSSNKKVIASTDDIIGHAFTPAHAFTWIFDANLPTIFHAEVEFLSIHSNRTLDGDGYYFD
ncbi:hypothetical protein A2U01_0058920, partial [Trifolium medium]|nr:hypothetical protein [Trifolium medium]